MRALRNLTQKLRITRIREGVTPKFCQSELEKSKILKTKPSTEPKLKGKKKISKSVQETQDLQFFEKIEKIRGKQEFQG